MNFFAKYKLNKLIKKVKNFAEKRERGNSVNTQSGIKAYKELAKFYQRHSYDKKVPHAAILFRECYRNAAILGDPEAQYIFAKLQLEYGRFWYDYANSFNGHAIHHTYAKNAFTEAFNYLEQAEKGGYALAKRLHGLALINGWGVDINQDRGFKLVVESIDEEGAWAKATQIFEELELNKPEFFQAIMTAKQQH